MLFMIKLVIDNQSIIKIITAKCIFFSESHELNFISIQSHMPLPRNQE